MAFSSHWSAPGHEAASDLPWRADDVIERSRRRSMDVYRLDPGRADPPRILTATALQDHRVPMEDLLDVARSGMESLFLQIRDAGYVVLLADAHGVAVDFINNPLLDRELRHAGLYLGSCWSEDKEGTCAVALANLEHRPITVHHEEHFRAPNRALTCSAAPVLGADGRVLAVLDASALYSPDDKRSQHLVLQMVRSTARMVENAQFLKQFDRNLVLRLAGRREFLEVATEGLMALDERGMIVATNLAFQHSVGRTPAMLTGAHVEEIFDVKLERLLGAAQAHPEPLALRLLHSGEQCFGLVRGPRTFSSGIALQRPVIHPPNGSGLRKLAGNDANMARNVQQALRVVDKGLAILLQGESGTGKEAFAKAIHEASARRSKAFVAVNCAAIPDTLIESELFGYKEGAFTGARSKGARGKIQQAHGGTLFLDEIGDMPLAMQTRLLRVLAEREVTPLGSETPVPVDIQFVCATHRDLNGLVTDGQFRLDLFYRLNGVTLVLPSLRERTDREDLICELLQEEGQLLYARASVASPQALTALQTYHWPGNIRQLKNTLRAALALSGGDSIELEHLPLEIQGAMRASLPPSRMSTIDLPMASVDTAARSERDVLLRVLREHQWNITDAARSLGTCRATVYRRMQKLGIVSPNRQA
ncbi:sigma-54-dependent Fis family transcriptional regulator [Hydrogenophaga pseudoflava]|uniref:sigma-54-dependent Fis family transcriptional regulator n=1 Tax=Hydrogenophaga pseudoflava TaxID=47421 RepID=UPI0027E4F026|nr:sigma-54-dependent Fis family transcriptional regulator [Hydrogenophaga pseudoflava]MDQ7747264.1 sigma-54-dependent Fis family transcriptional regulator [Hydrogenophaga pseudoflava]